MNGPTRERLREEVIDQAAEWFNRHRSGNALTAKDQAAFLDWLRKSPLHVHGYLEVARVARAIPEALVGLEDRIGRLTADPREGAVRGNVVSLCLLAAEKSPAHESPSVSPYPPLRSKAYRLFGGVVMSAVICGLLAFMTGDVSPLWRATQQVITARHSKVRVVHLPDGSMVYLDGGAQIRVGYSPSARSIELVQGEALFKVAHDSAWPFRVRSGGAEIVDVGTQFDLDRTAGQTTITVLEGEVDVLQRAAETEAQVHSRPRLQAAPLLLRAGEQVQVGPAVIAPQIVIADVWHVTDWLHRDFSFDNRPLGQVVAEINRYASVQVQIKDPSLRKLRVNGVLDAYDTRSLVLFLKRYGDIERTSRAIVVSSRGSAPDRSLTSKAP